MKRNFIKQARLPRKAYKFNLTEVVAPYASAAGQKLPDVIPVYHKFWCVFDSQDRKPCNCGGIQA